MNGIRVEQEKLAARKPLHEGEWESLLSSCRNERDRAMLTVAYECGVRVSELVGIERGQIDLRDRTLLVKGKGAKERRIALTDRAYIAILPFLEAVASGPIWLTRDGRPMSAKRAKRNMEEISKRANIKAHYHKLRTTFACRFLAKTHDLDSLQTLMGHEDANTTRGYAAYGAQQRAIDQMRRYSNPLM
jgi:site-specific recombinase XerD